MREEVRAGSYLKSDTHEGGSGSNICTCACPSACSYHCVYYRNNRQPVSVAEMSLSADSEGCCGWWVFPVQAG